MNEFRADLHCHSTCSDGSFSPSEILHLAKSLGLSALSITDHDTIEAYHTAIPIANELNITLLPGVEFSTSLNGSSVHILGYGFNLDSPDLLNLCAKHVERRAERNGAILELLKKHKMTVSQEDLNEVVENFSAKGSIGRPHIALAMVKKGYVSSVQEAFKKYIGEDRPCYTAGNPFSIQETIDVIHKSNGLAVIAHPHLINDESLLRVILELNFDGIECYYGNFHAKDHQRWLKIAEKKEWLITGGSDFHGTVKPNLALGSSWIDEKTFEILKSRTASYST